MARRSDRIAKLYKNQEKSQNVKHSHRKRSKSSSNLQKKSNPPTTRRLSLETLPWMPKSPPYTRNSFDVTENQSIDGLEISVPVQMSKTTIQNVDQIEKSMDIPVPKNSQYTRNCVNVTVNHTIDILDSDDLTEIPVPVQTPKTSSIQNEDDIVNQTDRNIKKPQSAKFLEELVNKAQKINPPLEIVIVKRIPKFTVPHVQLKNVMLI